MCAFRRARRRAGRASSDLRAEQPIIMRPAVLEAGWLVIMTTTRRLYARTSAWPAIAAALALSSTPALAQEAPQPAQPTTATPPAAPAEPAPAADQPAPSADSSATAQASDTSTKAAAPTVKRPLK